MSTTVTGSPPQGQVASHRGGARGHAAPWVRHGLRLPRASTTPGKLWLVRAGPVTDLEAAINADQAVFASNARPARTRSPAWKRASSWRPC